MLFTLCLLTLRSLNHLYFELERLIYLPFSEFILCIYPVQQDLLDPPEDFFRIRMIIILLQTCGHYFDRGSSKRKLDKFLLYFQRYVLNKGPLPLDVEFEVQVSLPLNISSIIERASLKYMNTRASLHYICTYMVTI
jgi:hypothetical protein